ncbi:MAG: hypothetical protein V7637_3092 [Mycobacteriales bacterium]
MNDDELIDLLRSALADPAAPTADSAAPAADPATATADPAAVAELHAAMCCPAPAPAVRAAEAAFGWLRTGAEVAAVVFDSAASQAGVRGPGPRQLSYRFDDLQIDCEVAADRLLAQVQPPVLTGLELCSADGARRPLTVDEHGRASVRPVPAGPLSLRCVRAGRPDVMTPWLLA